MELDNRHRRRVEEKARRRKEQEENVARKKAEKETLAQSQKGEVQKVEETDDEMDVDEGGGGQIDEMLLDLEDELDGQ